MKPLTFEDGIVRLGGEAVPGLLASLTIDGEVRYDEQKVDGQSGKSKTPKGFEDQTVTVTMTLCTDDETDCYEKLAQLAPFFRKTDEQANPEIYDLVNRHAGARGIRQIIFDKLKSAETNRSDTITATLGSPGKPWAALSRPSTRPSRLASPGWPMWKLPISTRAARARYIACGYQHQKRVRPRRVVDRGKHVKIRYRRA